jgi:hypothetical protein
MRVANEVQERQKQIQQRLQQQSQEARTNFGADAPAAEHDDNLPLPPPPPQAELDALHHDPDLPPPPPEAYHAPTAASTTVSALAANFKQQIQLRQEQQQIYGTRSSPSPLPAPQQESVYGTAPQVPRKPRCL